MFLVAVYISNRMSGGNRLATVEEKKQWMTGMPTFDVPTDVHARIEFFCNNFDIFELIQRDANGDFVVDTTYMNTVSATTKLGGIITFGLEDSGFKLKNVVGDPDDVLVGLNAHMTICSHLVRGHFLISCNIAFHTSTYFPDTCDPFRRVLLPTELGVYDGVGRACQTLATPNGLFSGFSHTYAEQKMLVQHYIGTNPVQWFLRELAGPELLPTLCLSTMEQQCAPFKQLISWHQHIRSLSMRSTKECTTTQTTWASSLPGADISTTPADVVTAAYMNQVLHNLASNDYLTCFTVSCIDTYYTGMVYTTTARFTSLPWLMFTTDLSDLSPFLGDFHNQLPDDPTGPPLLRSHEIEYSTGL